ncbi:hypothetical protein [Algisphaera agarilytica]|uniref:Uncharacterized protein n=1 Tax=Algisphaera agarilytica TaxID=1385975 RepID=A0A7X0H5U6_9BACT|nr:hypothetical protein [Algisphaera agarilytica]MBB6429848.1 hypothetical protein [Algisphaera agarilytica]
MSKDRLTQLVALLVIIVALTGSMLMINPINQQRRDLQLTFAVDSNQADPPQYALLAAGLGSFRGVAVNTLWYRMEMMKRDGQFAEANTLATWITYLQPRFPQVWGFQAWNMAYNFSVETYTPQERYDWVNKGIRLLREQGIPYNPNSVRLYRELGWILFHKVGQSTDDVNWYYKGEFAREWEELLGAAPEQLNAAGVISEMGRIAVMADRYFAVDSPNVRVSQDLEALIEAEVIPEINERAEALQDMGIVALDQALRSIRQTVPDRNEEGQAGLDLLLESTADQLNRAERDAATAFVEDYPAAGVLVDELRRRGMGLDQKTLRAFGKCIMYLRFRSPEIVQGLPDSLMPPEAREVLPLILQVQAEDLDSGLREALLGELLPFLRAKVLIEDYHMQPVKMYQYMAPIPENKKDDPFYPGHYGPLDWRHPHTHSLYWARLGVEQYFDLRDESKVDILNTQRMALHSMQALSDAGTVSFNPFNRPGQQIDLLPDPDYIEGYFKIVDETKAMANDEQLGQRIREEAFEGGEENFLQKAVLYSFLYGSRPQAEYYYQRLIDEYSESGQAYTRGIYENLSLEDFVAWMIYDDDLGRPGMISLINSRFIEAYRQGLASGNVRGMQVFNQNLALAQNVHRMYNEKFSYETGLDVGGGRLRLPPFSQMAEDAFAQFMTDRKHDLFIRLNAYRTAYINYQSLPLAPRTYRRWEQAVSAEVVAAGFDPAVAIPEPPNVVETVEGAGGQQGGATIQRQ